MYEVSRKEAFAAVTLIAIALTAMAWAQMTIGTGTATIVNVTTTTVSVPNLGKVLKNSAGTDTGTLKVKVDANGTYVIKVALIDSEGLYESMNTFVVTIKDNSGVYAILTLDEPVATFTADLTANTEKSFDIIVSWRSGPKVSGSIEYGVVAEVVAAYP